MIRFDLYEQEPYMAAVLMQKYGLCENCPMRKKCEEEELGNDEECEFEQERRCREMWWEFFKEKGRIYLATKQGFVEFLSHYLKCVSCPSVCGHRWNRIMEDCKESITAWLDEEISISRKSRQVGLEGLHPDDAKAVEEILERASNNAVHHPDHYQLVDGVEVIDVIKGIMTRSDFTGLQGYYLGNVLKYILRADQKNGREDYEKAAVYLEWLIQSMEEQENDRRNDECD